MPVSSQEDSIPRTSIVRILAQAAVVGRHRERLRDGWRYGRDYRRLPEECESCYLFVVRTAWDEAMSNPVATHTVRAACPHDCPDTCALEVTVGDDRVVKVSGAADHPPTAGVLCTKVAYYPERIHHADRLLYPARRVGAKGPGARFERISWDEALATIARRFQRIVASDGAEAIVPYSYAGNSGLLGYGSMDRRFFHRLGASRLDRTICASAGALGYQATIGASVGLDPENVVDARLIILWGSNSVVSNLHFWRLVQEAKRRGARLIAIDPCRTVTADKCDQHIALLPGTDAALALGLMHVLIRDGLIDHDYIARHTLGFAALRERVLAYPPARSSRRRADR